jgi:hypothetical protein
VLCPERIGFQRLLQRVVEGVEFVEGRAPLVLWLSGFGRSDHFRMVFLDSPVRLAIWCSESLSRKYIRRIFPNISMLITLCSPARKVSRSS